MQPPDESEWETSGTVDDPAAEPVVDASGEEPVETVHSPCRRCRRLVSELAANCPYCGLRRVQSSPEFAEQAPGGCTTPPDSGRGWSVLIAGFAVSLVAFILCDLILTNSALVDFDDERQKLIAMGCIDGVYAFIVVVFAIALRRYQSIPRPDVAQWIVWPVSFVAMGLALAANFGYHQALISMGVRELELVPAGSEYWPWWIVTICVQPAIFEELFFRGSAWKVMSGALGLHATVIVSSAMFGMAHIGVPLSIPVLMVVGLVLGYARAYSGSILLPAILHFLHNLAVVLW